MIRDLPGVWIVLWVQPVDTGQQLSSYWPEHNNSPMARSTLWGQKVTEKACPSSYQSTKRHLFSKESHRKTVYHPVRACCPGAERERKRGTGKERKRWRKQRTEDGQQGVEESLWALEKFLQFCPSSQNGGERSAAWQPTTRDTFTGGRPWWRTENRAKGSGGERL